MPAAATRPRARPPARRQAPTARRPAEVAEVRLTRLMGACFAAGAICFLVAPLHIYSSRVSAHADALTFVLGAILFTAGGLTQSRLAFPERRPGHRGRLAWRGAWVQSLGTLLFNLMTLEALSHRPASTGVWAPNALGSLCFLASGALLYLSAPRRGWRICRRAPGWWEPPVNLLGCLLFAVSAVASVPRGSGLLDPALANWTTSAGAACFLLVALAPLVAGMSFKVPRLSRLVAFEGALERELGAAETRVEVEFDAVIATAGD